MTTERPGPAGGALLAGGGSRRMGRPKALLPFGDGLLIERPARALSAVVDDWCVFGGEPSALAFLGRPVIPDADGGNGPLEGLLAALRHFSDRPVLVLACDLPFVGAEHLRSILGRAAEARCQAVVAVDGERSQPLCGWYASSCAGPLERALGAGRRGVLDFVRTLDRSTVDCSSGGGVGCLVNVNSPADYERAVVRLRTPAAEATGLR